MAPATIAIGTSMVEPDYLDELRQQPATHIGAVLRNFPAARLLMFDIQTDRAALLRRFEELIDAERERIGIDKPTKRGRRLKRGLLPADRAGDLAGFLRTAIDLQIVPLWDLQLAGSLTASLEVARVLYPHHSEENTLRKKIGRASRFQNRAEQFVDRLRASTQ
jgi:hypothetical protein